MVAVRCILAGVVAGLLATAASGNETDQFLVWDIELTDSAPVLNEYINGEIQALLDYRNAAIEPPCDCEGLALEVYAHLFKGRSSARVKKFVRKSGAVELYPPRSVSNIKHMNMSIYRGVMFPYVLPMARTLRVGDVYIGDDKLGHFFGFGKRYYKRYLLYVRQGMTPEDAEARVVRWGVISENSVVGRGVDGVFSHADLEANFQGYRFGRDLCEGDAAYFRHRDGRWVLTRPFDFRDYVNPNFDESFNPSHFGLRRRGLVLPILRDEYAELAHGDLVMERFRRYNQAPPSRSMELVREYFLERGRAPQRDQVFAALGLPPGYPNATYAVVPVP